MARRMQGDAESMPTNSQLGRSSQAFIVPGIYGKEKISWQVMGHLKPTIVWIPTDQKSVLCHI